MKNLHIFLAAFITVTTNLAYSQDKQDYIITLKGDTVYGKLQKGLIDGKPRLVTGEEKFICDPDEIKAYYRAEDSTLFRSYMPHDSEQNLWAIVLEDGYIKLYNVMEKRRVQMSNGLRPKTTFYSWFTIKPGLYPYDLKSVRRKDRNEYLKKLFADDETVLKEYEAMKEFSLKGLRDLVKSYNEHAAQRTTNTSKQSAQK